ncbi:hypothetical protein E4T39_03937 [Aureobasidium subglaciale]|nr:hypothetical protein E4T39_03937 [Aureobasidium subglaciale]
MDVTDSRNGILGEASILFHQAVREFHHTLMKRRTFLTLAELNRPAFTSTTNGKQYSSTSNDKMTDSQSHEEEKKGTPLGLPAPPAEGIKLDVSSGEGVALDHLGPMVVNKDGTISRITNWDKMAEVEKKNTLRILQKRNKQRLEALKQAGQDESK